MKDKFSSTVAGAAILLTIVGIISKSLGFFREIIFAGFFGLSEEFDMYLVGCVLPLTLGTIILYLGQNYLIPAGNRIKKDNPELIQNFMRTNLFIFTIFSTILSILLFVTAEWIIAMYLYKGAPETISGAVLIFRLYLITVPLSAAVSVLSAYNQLYYNFKFPAYSGLILNISFIIIILLFSDKLNIFIIPVAYIIGSLLQLFYLLKNSQVKLRGPGFNFTHFKSFITSTLVMIVLIESIGQLYLITDRYFKNFIPVGGMSALNYAQNIFYLPVSVLSIALSTAIFPRLSASISRNEIKELEQTFNNSIRINVAIFLPISVILIYYGQHLIQLVFERGKFAGNDTIQTHDALIYFSISLVFYAVYSVSNKMFYSLGIVKQLLYITLAGIALKIFFNFLLVGHMQQNGLALSTSISFIFFSLSGLFLIFKKLAFKIRGLYFQEFSFQLINALLSLFIVKSLSGMISVTGIHPLIEIILFSLMVLINTIVVKHSIIKFGLNTLSLFLNSFNLGIKLPRVLK